MKNWSGVGTLIVALLLALPAWASEPNEVGLRFSLGLGGKDKPKIDGHKAVKSDIYEPSIGLHAHYMYQLGHYFKVGPMFGPYFVNTDNADQFDIGYSTFIDIAVLAKPFYQFRAVPLEVFGIIHIGPSIYVPNSDWQDTDLPMKVGGGINFGFGIGVQYVFSRQFGVGIDLVGIELHWLKTKTDDPNAGHKVEDLFVQYSMGLVNLNYRF